MKKTRKIISVIVAMLMVLGIMVPMASAAEFSDVASTHKYYTAISDLSAYGILNGFEDGTFRPEDNVTRAQFAKIICIAKFGATGITGAVETGFTDVDPNHWAAGYIKLASANGIINGMGDGTFAPEANVKFEQAVKMIVCALGYPNTLEYPQGFINVAADNGLFKGLAASDNVQGQDANRGAIAKLITNMMDAETITSTGEKGGSIKDQIVKTEKESGQVVSVYGSTIFADETSECSRNQIEVQMGRERRTFSVSELDDVKANVNDYLGKRVTVYYDADDDLRVPILTNLTLQAKKNIITTIDLSDIEEYSNTEILYIADREEGEEEELSVKADANILYNGVATDDDLEDLIDIDKPGQITFLDSDADGDADVVFIKEYTTIIVKSKTSSSFKIYGENDGESLVLDEDKASITIKKNGKTSEFKNISTGDVVSYASSDGDKVIDVLVSNKVVSGTINNINKNQGTIEIKTSSGKETFTKSAYYDAHSTATLEAGVSGKFYIDAFGKIVKADVSSDSAYTYAYLTGFENVGASTAPSYSIQAIKLNGQSSATKVTYGLANRFKIDGVTFTQDDDEADVLDALEAGANIFDPEFEGFEADETFNQVIKFTTNSSGKVDKIITAAYDLDEDNALTIDKMSAKCTTSGKTLEKKYNIGSAKVLLISEDEDTKDEFKGYSASYFKSGSTTYKVLLIDMEDYKAPYIIVYGGSGTASVMWEDYAPVVVTGKGQAVPEGAEDPANYIDVITAGGSTAQYFESEDSAGILKSVKVGDVLRVSFDGEGLIAEIKVSTTLAKMVGGTQAAGAVGEGTNKSQTNAEYREIFGTANMVNGDSLIVALAFVDEDGELDTTDEENITIGSSTKVIVIDSEKVESGNKTPITVEVPEEIIGFEAQPDNASKIMIYTSNSTTAKTIFVFK